VIPGQVDDGWQFHYMCGTGTSREVCEVSAAGYDRRCASHDSADLSAKSEPNQGIAVVVIAMKDRIVIVDHVWQPQSSR
jgi:hypothetical protein